MADGSAMLIRRWMIKGTLTTDGPLHIGSGEHNHDPRLKKRKSEDLAMVSMVARDCHGRPYIPASTLKGNVRSFARSNVSDVGDSFIESFFGSDDAGNKGSVGGKAAFLDGMFLADLAAGPDRKKYVPYWSEECLLDRPVPPLTGIMTSTQINRRTRTVADGKLFHAEFVPKGMSFEVRIAGQDTHGETGWAEVEQFLTVMDGFNDGGITLGSNTGSDWGRMRWKFDDLLVFDAETAKMWFESDEPAVGYGMLRPVDPSIALNIRAATADKKLLSTADHLRLDIQLNFEGSFLVDDASRSRKEGEERTKDGPRNHEPLLNSDGLLVLPASSFRGAFRSQAERILRTIGDNDAACYPDNNGPRKTCGPLTNEKHFDKLCPACKLFGAAGWRSPLDVQDFKAPSRREMGEEIKQDFVAIDRFTGGASAGAKFDARSYYQPRLKGAISLNAAALERTGNADALRGLLILTLRDLKEGDIRFGFGAAKGYGACTAEIMTIRGNAGIAAPTGFLDEIKEYFAGGVSTAEQMLESVGALHDLCRLEKNRPKGEEDDHHAVS